MSGLILFVALSFAVNPTASPADPKAKSKEESGGSGASGALGVRASRTIPTPNRAVHGVVKIWVQSADPFTAHTVPSHGTGFFVGRKGNKGFIFTNGHVAEKATAIDVLDLTLALATDTRIAEDIKAKVVFKSPLSDFAVLEFDLSQMRRSKDFFKPLRLPGKKSPWYDFEGNFNVLQSERVYAVGNPFDSENAITWGHITTIKHDPHSGVMIQTDAAINPGNSGGPLISETTGEVVGMNTSIYEGANSVGFAIPIGVLMEEWRLAQQNPEFGKAKTTMALFGPIDAKKLTLSGLDKLIRKEVPDYFDHYASAIIVEAAEESSGFRRGDIVLAADGELLGDSIYRFDYIRQLVSGALKVHVLREGRMVEIEAPAIRQNFRSLRESVDFVYVSGYIFDELNPVAAWLTTGNKNSRVVLSSVLQTHAVNFGNSGAPELGSVVEAVSFGGPEIRLSSLLDLKMALRNHPNAKSIQLFVREAMVGHAGARKAPIPQASGAPAISNQTTTFVFPISEVLTPSDFSLHRFRRQFSFEDDEFETRNWRDHLRSGAIGTRSTKCAGRLTGNNEE